MLDGSAYTKWLAFNYGAPAWLAVQLLGRERRITEYALTSANDCPERDPACWQLQGSLDGHVWDTVDTRTDVEFPDRYETQTFHVPESSSKEFRYYRLLITSTHASSDCVQLAGLVLRETTYT